MTATALFHDIWAGHVPAVVKPFKTKRNGVAVIRYRWEREDGLHCCSAVFQSVAGAVAAKRRDQRFSNIVEA